MVDLQSITRRQSSSYTDVRRLLLIFGITIIALIVLVVPGAIAIATPQRYNVQYDVHAYHNLSMIYEEIDKIRHHPMFARALGKLEEYQLKTLYDNPLQLIQIGGYDNNRLKVLITFGEHAREFITVESAFDLIYYILDSLLLCPNTDSCEFPSAKLARWILQHVQLDLIPILNPDGRARLENIAADPRKQRDKSRMCWRNNGQGVDLNRNADWEFGGEGSSDIVNHEEYRGKYSFSETETQYIKELATNRKYTAYVSIHSGERQFFTPFVDTNSRKLKRKRTPDAVARKEADLGTLIMSGSGDWFRNWGNGWEMNSYSADGTIYDWMAGKMQVPYCYCVEIWGDSTIAQPEDCFVQFNPAPESLHDDLVKMRRFYLAFLLGLVQIELGKVYPYSNP